MVWLPHNKNNVIFSATTLKSKTELYFAYLYLLIKPTYNGKAANSIIDLVKFFFSAVIVRIYTMPSIEKPGVRILNVKNKKKTFLRVFDKLMKKYLDFSKLICKATSN